MLLYMSRILKFQLETKLRRSRKCMWRIVSRFKKGLKLNQDRRLFRTTLDLVSKTYQEYSRHQCHKDLVELKEVKEVGREFYNKLFPHLQHKRECNRSWLNNLILIKMRSWVVTSAPQQLTQVARSTFGISNQLFMLNRQETDTARDSQKSEMPTSILVAANINEERLIKNIYNIN